LIGAQRQEVASTRREGSSRTSSSPSATTGVLKNAIDYLYVEWPNKAEIAALAVTGRA
jgi:hypothetical protein